MVKTSAQPYKHVIYVYIYNHIQRTALSRRTAITQPTHCYAGQQQLFSTAE